MKKPQFIIVIIAVAAIALLLIFGRTKPYPEATPAASEKHVDNHSVIPDFSIDSLIASSKKSLNPQQLLRLDLLEKSITRGDVKKQQTDVYHQLAHFWRDTGRAFIPFAWYTAEGARLENSEKSLTFAGHLLLNQVQTEENAGLRKWMALQAKDLLERSLIINPANDSSKVGIGAAYLFGGISEAPMEGIAKIREVVQRDSSNVYAQLTLALGSLASGQTDKAKERLQTVTRLQPGNLQAVLMLADLYEREGDKAGAMLWYGKALQLTERADLKAELEKRIAELKK